MRRTHLLVLAFFFGLLFCFLLNGRNIHRFFTGDLTVVDLGAQVGGSADEVYYFALIRDVADGFFTVGNASSYEHRHAASVVGYAPLLQGLLMRETGWNITTVVLIGDILFTMLIGATVFLVAYRSTNDTLLALALGVTVLAWNYGGWLRTLSPEIVGLLFLAALLALIVRERLWTLVIRGTVIVMLSFSQPVYAEYLLIVEGLLAVLRFREVGVLPALKERIPIIIAVVLVATLKIFLALSDPDPIALFDTYQRMGLIPSRLPTAPTLQLYLLLALSTHFWAKRRVSSSALLDRTIIPVLLVSGLIALNQSLLLGIDAIFGLYFVFPFTCMLFFIWGHIATLLLPRTACRIGGVILVALYVSMVMQRAILVPFPSNTASAHEISEISELLLPLAGEKETKIIAAPLTVSNFIPVFTPHYALFTQYAHFQYARDQELAERYLLEHALFPLHADYTVEGDPLVFGIYAGNRYGRAKTLCRIKRIFSLADPSCDTLNLSDFIAHQDVRAFIEKGDIDVIAGLKKYGVTTIITDLELPAMLRSLCRDERRVGTYRLYDCDL